MQVAVAQAVALVVHGNAALRRLERPRFFPGHSTCRFCEWVRFVDATRRPARRRSERPVAGTPDDWFARLVAEGARRLSLAYRSSTGGPALDLRTAGFAGGGGSWWILSEAGDGTSEGWLGRWDLGDREAPDRRIWRVTYARSGEAPVPAEATALAASAEALERSLEGILRFSRARADGHFAASFEKGLAALRTGEPRGFHEDLGPPGALPVPAVRLLDACQAAWVFGGMGWWNDQAFEGDAAREFDRVTQAHWEALTSAIAAAANASANPRPP